MSNSSASFANYPEGTGVPSAVKIAFSVVISFVALVSAIGNILVITAFTTTKTLRTSSTNYFTTSMAVSDLLWVAINWPTYLTSRLGSLEKAALPDIACKLGNYITFVSYSVSIESLVLITVDRFICTVLPTKVAMMSGWTRVVLIFLSWIMPMAFLSPYFFFSTTAHSPDNIYLCSVNMSGAMNTAYTIAAFLFMYIVPLIVISVQNFLIMKTLRRTNPAIQENNRILAVRRKQNQRITKMLSWISVSFFITWTPYYGYFVSRSLLADLSRKMQTILFMFCHFFLPFVSSASSPVILITLSSKYRQGLKNCLRSISDKLSPTLVPTQQVATEVGVADTGM